MRTIGMTCNKLEGGTIMAVGSSRSASGRRLALERRTSRRNLYQMTSWSTTSSAICTACRYSSPQRVVRKGSSTRQAVTIGPNTFKRRRAVGPTATTTTTVAPTEEEEPIYAYIWSDSNPTQHKWCSMRKALVFLTLLGEGRRSAHNGTAAEA